MGRSGEVGFPATESDGIYATTYYSGRIELNADNTFSFALRFSTAGPGQSDMATDDTD